MVGPTSQCLGECSLPHRKTLEEFVTLWRRLDDIEPVVPHLPAVQTDLARDAHPAVLAEDDRPPPDDLPDLRVLDHQGQEGLHHPPPVDCLPAAVPDEILQLVLVADLALQSLSLQSDGLVAGQSDSAATSQIISLPLPGVFLVFTMDIFQMMDPVW